MKADRLEQSHFGRRRADLWKEPAREKLTDNRSEVSNTRNDLFNETTAHRFRFGNSYYELRKLSLSFLFEEIGNRDVDRNELNTLHRLINQHVSSAGHKLQIAISPVEKTVIIDDIVNDLIGFGPLEELLARDDISDIMVVGPNTIFFERDGILAEANIQFQDEAHLRTICQRIARRVGRRIDESSPMCDARLPDGSRVNIVVPPLAIDGTALTIRKFRADRLTLEGLVAAGTLNRETVTLLTYLVQIRCNIMVIGSTGSGKTTLLNCLNQTLSDGQRIVTCEDAAELQLQQRHIVRLETRMNNLEGTGEIPMRALIRNSLRMRPDRIIVGEIRGEEAFDFIQAMNTGHDGSMGTMHANSSFDALSRLEGLISLGAPSLPSRTVQQMITSALDIIIEVRRFRDGKRRVSHILEIIKLTDEGIEARSIFECDPDNFYISQFAQNSRQYRIHSARIRRKAAHMGLLDKIDQFGD